MPRQMARSRVETPNLFMRLIEARKNSVGDPAVFVDGKRIDDDGHFIIEHQPSTANAPLNEISSSPQKGPLNARGGVPQPRRLRSARPGEKTKFPIIQNPLTGGFAVALDGLDDNFDTTQRFPELEGTRRPSVMKHSVSCPVNCPACSTTSFVICAQRQATTCTCYRRCIA